MLRFKDTTAERGLARLRAQQQAEAITIEGDPNSIQARQQLDFSLRCLAIQSRGGEDWAHQQAYANIETYFEKYNGTAIGTPAELHIQFQALLGFSDASIAYHHYA
jgi:hypothetical protein